MSYKNLLYIKLKPDSRPIRWTLQMEATFYGSRATGIYVSRKFGLSHLMKSFKQKFAWRSVKKLSKLDFTDFYYSAEQKFVSLVTSLFENPVRSAATKICPL